MNLNDIFIHLDSLYSQKKMDEAYQFLLQQTQIAMQQQNDEVVLALLSELIGYYRVTAKFHEGQMICQQAIKILDAKGMDESIVAATTYLNIATLYRAQGSYQDALFYYRLTEDIYQKELPELDERYSAFYNNVSLLYQEMGQYDEAIKYGLKALNIVSQLDDCRIEEATSYVNLAQMYFSINDLDNGKIFLNNGIELFQKYNPEDPHYFAALASLAQCYYVQKEYQKAIDLYNQVLLKIESIFGKNKDYQIVYQNKLTIEKEMKQLKGLDICQKYYETYGKPMIEKNFKEYLPYMAIGLCGFGSECLGYDDYLSHDHDFGPGFCIWLPLEIYECIGQSLQQAYASLPQEFMGIRRMESAHGQGRVGVFVIEDFFQQFLFQFPHHFNDWLYIDENALLACTNGRIFEDHYGKVTQIREALHYYPEDIRIKKIARAAAKMAQSGQYNYARCMTRHNEVAASLALNEFIDQTLSMIYLLNKRYKPYYKWSYYGLKDCHVLKDCIPLIEELVQLPSQIQFYKKERQGINRDDHKVVIIEKICQKVIYELQKQGLTQLDDDFLENHTYSIMQHIQDDVIKNKHVMEG